MKPKNELSTTRVKYHCISCDYIYVTDEFLSKEDRVTKEINICKNCSPAYNAGTSASTMKVSSIEKFYARSKKVKTKPEDA